MFLFLLICSLLVPISMTILGRIWSKEPPRDRNGMSGYRTSMSQLNEDTWKYAHRCWGKINYFLGLSLVILTIIVLMVIKNNNEFETIVTHIVFIQIGIYILTVIPVEIQLNRVFDKYGHRK